MQLRVEEDLQLKSVTSNPDNSSREDYSDLLKQKQISYTASEYYWQIAEIAMTQGWVLYLSVIKSQVESLLQIIIPFICQQNVPFKIVRNRETAGYLLDGSLGYINLGKLVCIYPRSDHEALTISKNLNNITSSFQGPAIPSARCLGGIVYTSYGSFNPILKINDYGETEKYIYDTKGQLILDKVTIPFSIPADRPWPFSEIASPLPPKQRKLLNYSYYPLITLKNDAKGNVLKALYFKHFWRIKSCLIKQGKKYTSTDTAGRDSQDRLKWQYYVHKSLSDSIPVPKVFDLFSENGDTYLAMEFIKGISLYTWIYLQFKTKAWTDLSMRKKIKIVDRLLEIFAIVKQLHAEGYIHRDITPENFLITKNKQVYLIDLELSWSTISEEPTPPFRLGTDGFMSPEQIRTEKPTIKEDIYALAGLIIVFFVNLPPTRFYSIDAIDNVAKLNYFIGDASISNMIVQCRQDDPSKRPPLETIVKTLQNYKTKLQNTTASTSKSAFAFQKTLNINDIIQKGINGLSYPLLVSPKNVWTSKSQQREEHIVNEGQEVYLLNGWYNGMAGPIWLMGLARKAGFKIGQSEKTYYNSLAYLEKKCSTKQNFNLKGLFSGLAGTAFALTEGIKNGLIPKSPHYISLLSECFSTLADNLSLASGISGQGLALLSTHSLLDTEQRNKSLELCTSWLIESQNVDGSWTINSDNPNYKGLLLGLHKGLAGVIWYLLCFYKEFPEPLVKKTILKGITYLLKCGNKGKSGYAWPISTKSNSKDHWSSDRGTLGIILCLLRAYELIKNPLYKNIAESSLRNFGPRPLLVNFTLSSGLPALGEVYLEAQRVLGSSEWSEKTTWLANTLGNTFLQVSQDQGYWITDGANNISADLFTGNSGVLHFLIRHQFPNMFGHPLSPS